MLKVAGGGGVTTGAVVYKGTWNASTNTPTLTSSVGTQSDYYVVSVAGSTNLNGITDWQIGDWAIFNGSAWQKVDNTDAVTSVNGQTGTVVLTAANVGATPNTTYVLAGTGMTGGGQLTGNVTMTLANTAVTAATYGTASSVSQVTVDAQGRITSATNVAIAIANSAVSGLGTMSTQNANAVAITGGTFANANITSVAATFPNSYLANSTATLGNATITLGSTTSTVGNLTLNNVTINSGTLAANVVNVTTTTASTATFATASLPLVPAGYISINLNGTIVKIPYYAV